MYFWNTLKGNYCYSENVSKWEFDKHITPQLYLFLKKLIAFKNTTTMHGSVFNHDMLHLIIIVLCVHFVVNANKNQAIST